MLVLALAIGVYREAMSNIRELLTIYLKVIMSNLYTINVLDSY
jgi:hypothetical protein